MKYLHINDKSKPLIIVGSSANMTKIVDICNLVGIVIAGIIDNDYYGNTKLVCDLPVIDKLENLHQYKDTHNFFCAINWEPFDTVGSIRNKNKRMEYISQMTSQNSSCISLVDPFARIASNAKIGYGVFIDAFVLVETEAVIEDFVNVYAYAAVGHHAVIKTNTVLQRYSSVAGDCICEENVFIGTAVKALKPGSTFGANTFIHEGIYIRRGTIPNEVISMKSKNLSRVYDMAEVSQLS